MCILLHNNRVGISGNITLFSYMFCPNTGKKFREPYHSNHVIPTPPLPTFQPPMIFYSFIFFSLEEEKMYRFYCKLSSDLNLLYTGRLFYCYMLEESICHFRGVESIFSLLFYF